eukprot:TRINITY_DN5377_c0_g1_i1.p1 TRINITY_DN5377_c0_g1~~TRINITY_DN5377_c0_g1_i1.p1  ORF type:complete len:213 (-),score=87.34 TRINITY_DN5377_c0_g1_i1:108-746(-)
MEAVVSTTRVRWQAVGINGRVHGKQWYQRRVHGELRNSIFCKMNSTIRQNYHEDCEAMINKQINTEFYASYVYLSMSSYFNRSEQALHGFAKFFLERSENERTRGVNLMEYQAKRGGKVVLLEIAKPNRLEWGTAMDAMIAALDLEKTVNKNLLDLQKTCEQKEDAHLGDYIPSEFLDEQVEGIKAIGDMITQMKRVGDGLGLHIMDKELEG